jgi:addiction module RelE/StbE family toxin
MICLQATERFLDASARLPKQQQNKLGTLLQRLAQNPFHPQLHTKPLHGNLTGLYSFRITRDWRVVFEFLDPSAIRLLRVAHRKDMYR